MERARYVAKLRLEWSSCHVTWLIESSCHGTRRKKKASLVIILLVKKQTIAWPRQTTCKRATGSYCSAPGLNAKKLTLINLAQPDGTDTQDFRSVYFILFYLFIFRKTFEIRILIFICANMQTLMAPRCLGFLCFTIKAAWQLPDTRPDIPGVSLPFVPDCRFMYKVIIFRLFSFIFWLVWTRLRRFGIQNWRINENVSSCYYFC